MTAGIPEGQMPYFCETLGSSEDGVASLLHSAEKLKVDVRVGWGGGGVLWNASFQISNFRFRQVQKHFVVPVAALRL